jgi:hypothetical protein
MFPDLQLRKVALKYVDFLDRQKDDGNARALFERALDLLPSHKVPSMFPQGSLNVHLMFTDCSLNVP